MKQVPEIDSSSSERWFSTVESILRSVVLRHNFAPQGDPSQSGGRTGQKSFPRARLGRRPAVWGFYAWQYSGCPMKAGTLSESGRIRPHLTLLECGIIFGGIPAGAISRKGGLIWGIPAYSVLVSGSQLMVEVCRQGDLCRWYLRILSSKSRMAWPRGLAGKPLAGFRATPDRRIIVLCGMIVYVIRFKNPPLHR